MKTKTKPKQKTPWRICIDAAGTVTVVKGRQPPGLLTMIRVRTEDDAETLLAGLCRLSKTKPSYYIAPGSGPHGTFREQSVDDAIAFGKRLKQEYAARRGD